MSKSIKDRMKELEKEQRLLAENLADALGVADAETLRHEYLAPLLNVEAGKRIRDDDGKW